MIRKSKLTLVLLLVFIFNTSATLRGQATTPLLLPELEVISVENASNPAHLETLEGFTFWTLFSAFSPDDRFVAATGAYDGARIWDVQTGGLLTHLPCPKTNLEGWTGGFSFSPDGTLLAVACESSVLLWDVAIALQEIDAQPTMILRAGQELVDSVVFDNTGRYLVAKNNNRRFGVVWLWDIRAQTQLAMNHHASGVCCLSFNPTGELLAYTDGVSTHIWNTETLQEVSTITSRWLAFNSNWTLVVETDLGDYGGALQTGMIQLQNLQNDQPSAVLLHTNNYLPPTLNFNSDGTLLIYGNVEERNMLVWNTKTHEQLTVIETAGVTSLTFSHNGKLIVTTHATAGGPQGQVELWGVPLD